MTRQTGAPVLGLRMVDVAPLVEQHAAVPGVYLAVFAYGGRESFRGGTIYASREGTTYGPLAPITGLCPFGYVISGFPDTTVAENQYDSVSQMTVRMIHGTLSTVGEPGLERGENLALVGSEIMGIGTATLTTAPEYTCSQLLRGQRDTDPSEGHTGLEELVMLDTRALIFVPLDIRDLSETFYLRAVAAGEDVDDAETLEVVPQGNTVRPFRPVQVAGSRDGSNNLTISWEMQSRSMTSLVGAGSPLSYEETIRYEIDILDAPGGSVLRTISPAVDAVTADYSAADQTTDGLTPGDPVDVVVYQVSDLYNRGNGRAATV